MRGRSYRLRHQPLPHEQGPGEDPKPANAPPGSNEGEGAAKPANAPSGSDEGEGVSEHTVASPASPPDPHPRGTGRASGCEPWRDVIRAKRDLGFTAQRIYQDLVTENGFAGTYYCVRRFVRRLEESRDLRFRRVECKSRDEAQIDFGAGAPVVNPDGKRRSKKLASDQFVGARSLCAAPGRHMPATIARNVTMASKYIQSTV